MARIASAVFFVILLETVCASLDNDCICTPNKNGTTTFTLLTPGLHECDRQWMDENGTVLTYNEEFDNTTGVLFVTLQSIVIKGCPEKLKYDDCIHPQDLIRRLNCTCDCHGYNKSPIQSDFRWAILIGFLCLLLFILIMTAKRLNWRCPGKKEHTSLNQNP